MSEINGDITGSDILAEGIRRGKRMAWDDYHAVVNSPLFVEVMAKVDDAFGEIKEMCGQILDRAEDINARVGFLEAEMKRVSNRLEDLE